MFLSPQKWRDEAVDLRPFRVGCQAAADLARSLRGVKDELKSQFRRAYSAR